MSRKFSDSGKNRAKKSFTGDSEKQGLRTVIPAVVHPTCNEQTNNLCILQWKEARVKCVSTHTLHNVVGEHFHRVVDRYECLLCKKKMHVCF